MRRIIMVSLGIRYPRGDAKSNYLQYLSDALIAEGYQVEMLVGTNPQLPERKNFHYHGAHVRNLMAETGCSLLDRLLNGKLFYKRLEIMLKALDLSDQDLIMGETFFDPVIRKLQQKYGFKTAGWIHEWFGREQYGSDAEYQKGEAEFRAYGDKDLIYPISHHIAEQFTSCSCRSLVLPIMADTREVPYVPKKLTDRYEFIYPANNRMKDSLADFLKGAASLSDAYRSRMRFHLTGIKEAAVMELLSEEEQEKLKDVLVVHKWMEYEDLVALYQSVHYLFFSRAVSQMTLSNFPSKVPEALTYGVVPVVSRVGEYTKYFLTDGEDSLIFDGDSEEVCQKALERALDVLPEELQRLSQNARHTAQTRFDYRNWQSRIRESIEALY